jgi:hypothetical protein
MRKETTVVARRRSRTDTGVSWTTWGILETMTQRSLWDMSSVSAMVWSVVPSAVG